MIYGELMQLNDLCCGEFRILSFSLTGLSQVKVSKYFEHKIVVSFLFIRLNMFWVPKRTVSLRQFF